MWWPKRYLLLYLTQDDNRKFEWPNVICFISKLRSDIRKKNIIKLRIS